MAFSLLECCVTVTSVRPLSALLLIFPKLVSAYDDTVTHVLRKNETKNHKSSGNTDADQRVQAGIAEAEQGACKEHQEELKEEENSTKKPRVRWTRELHDKFVEAINRLGTGTDQVVPRRIFSMMDVDYISRKSIGSHMQNFIEDDAFLKNSIEDDVLLKNFIEDDDLLKSFLEDDDLLKNSIGDDDLLNASSKQFVSL
ncbi:hypothetical protein BRADI_2g33650v3 [Brachypodium distachyon]|uniref:Myb-like domain-containing protein n=1 Tax=Brachypodium distachyon TaxID=15368 RepID=I1HL76_BRADI|nr:hypothetical protein BRADI_2g33650v3 [Brachypodium distachyon]